MLKDIVGDCRIRLKIVHYRGATEMFVRAYASRLVAAHTGSQERR